MSAINQQIKVSYELNAMSPEDIAEDQELDLTAVKAVLMQCSSKYRKDCGAENDEEEDLNFTKDELRQVNKVIFETALCAEHQDGTPDYKTRLVAATYIRDDKKGRKDVVRGVRDGNTFNILQLNEQLHKVRQLTSGIKRRFIEE